MQFSAARHASRMHEQGFSIKCRNLTTRWSNGSCRPCELKAGECPEPWLRCSGAMRQCLILHFYVVTGHKVSKNCGFDDDGGRHDVPFHECENGTFNDGSSAFCRPCTVCPPGHSELGRCNITTDAQCSTSVLSNFLKTSFNCLTVNLPKQF